MEYSLLTHKPLFPAEPTDFDLLTDEVVLTMQEPEGKVMVNIPRERGGHEDQAFETFTLTLTDAVGLATPNMFFRDLLVNIQDSGQSLLSIYRYCIVHVVQDTDSAHRFPEWPSAVMT